MSLTFPRPKQPSKLAFCKIFPFSKEPKGWFKCKDCPDLKECSAYLEWELAMKGIYVGRYVKYRKEKEDI